MDYITLHRRLSVEWQKAHERAYPRHPEGGFIHLDDDKYWPLFERLERVITVTQRVEDHIRGYYNAGKAVAR